MNENKRMVQVSLIWLSKNSQFFQPLPFFKAILYVQESNKNINVVKINEFWLIFYYNKKGIFFPLKKEKFILINL